MNALSVRVSLLTAAVTCLFSIPAIPGQLFRCGNAYQDHPCEGNQIAQPVKGVGQTKRSASSSANPERTHPECAQRGEDALKIVWAREAGVTEETASASETNPKRQQLITGVYRVRGSSPEVRARIEAECKTEMEERARVLALQGAMVKAGVAPAVQTAPGAPGAMPSADRNASEEKDAESTHQRREANTKKEKCDRLSSSLQANRNQQRQGGGAAEMDKLNRQRWDLERDFRQVGCA